ncbi:hypothetical protein B9Z55_008753 [Caenorhabditis nigoni]|uniref:Uncharacterized protein n=1 Tax=Caenorhabditis nigoni TaxID=1611254 RepID=A0A2G5UPJ3_9PELO|nr:hypothetical protein B9Z55_008753 [Caenorhabditis nigoni]
MDYREDNLHQGEYFYGNNNMNTTAYYPQQYSQQNYNQNFQDLAGNPNFGTFQSVQNVQYDYVKPGQVQSPLQYPNQMVQSTMSQQQWKQTQDFQKAQNLLLLDTPMGDGQMEIPEGPLSMCSTVYPDQFSPYPMQNNNNDNGDQHVQYNNNPNFQPWEKLEPVIQTDPQLMIRIDEELKEKIHKMEKNKGYSAKCLANKMNIMNENLDRANESFINSKFLEEQNDQKEEILKFAVEQIVIPNFDNNNCNYDMYYGIEAAKENVLDTVEAAKNKDEQLQQKKQKLQAAIENVKQREFDKEHQNTIPVCFVKNGQRLVVSKTTIATRLNRAKTQKTTCQSDYDAAINQYKIQRQTGIKEILDSSWNYFVPFVKLVLENAPADLWQRAQQNGQIENLERLQEWLKFNPG